MIRRTFLKDWSDREILGLFAKSEGSDSQKPSLVEIKAAEDELLERYKDCSDSELVFLSQSADPETQKLGLDKIKVAEAVLQARYRDWSDSELVFLAQSEVPKAQVAKGVMLVRYGGLEGKPLRKYLGNKDRRECLRSQIKGALIAAISNCDPSKLTHKGVFGSFALKTELNREIVNWHKVHFGLDSLLAYSRKPAASVKRMIEEMAQEISEKTAESFKDARDRLEAEMSHYRLRSSDSGEEFKRAYEGYEDPHQRTPHEELVRSEFLERWSVIKGGLSDDDQAFLYCLEQEVSNAQIARNLGVSKQYVGKMKKKLFEKVRQDRILADLAA